MKRTMRRPLPSGRLSVEHALAWAVCSGIGGVGLLAFQTNSLVAGLGAANILLYTLAYTPLKQIHPVNTWIGAVVGAIPPLMGWAAAAGQLDLGGWVLAAVLYFWQIPHFMALASLCSSDYAAGGYKMLSGKRAALIALRNCVYLLPVGFVAQHLGITSGFFGPEALVLTAGMGITAAMFYFSPTAKRARQLFRASLLYLPLFMGAMLLHRLPNIEQHKEHSALADCDAVMTEDVLLRDSEERPDRTLPKFDDRNFLESPSRPPIAFVSIAPFPFLPAPEYRTSFP
ncbi:hypothetical protein O6H91_10G016900 [Diphasiastrum complanatum]|nr:hypothetical protein O6H91_10G016900 [Diphasiastrum complanatum]